MVTDAKGYILYKRRWLVLFAYSLLAASLSQTTVCYVSVSNILQSYYNVDTFLVNTAAMMFTIGPVIFTFPISYLLHKFELAFTMNLIAVTNTTGCVIRYFSTEEDGFPLLLFGAGVSCFGYSGFLFIAPKVASNWFGESEVARATSANVGIDLLHVGLAFVITTSIIRNHPDKPDIKSDLKNFAVYQLVLAIATAVYILVVVRSHPPTPPSLQEQEKFEHRHQAKDRNNAELNNLVREEEKENEYKQKRSLKDRMKKSVFLKSLFQLLRNRDFLLNIALISTAYAVEVLYEALLNPVLIAKFPGREKDIGIVGCIAVLSGFFTNLLVGTIIDKTKAYKQLSVGIFSICAVCGIIWTILLEHSNSFVGLAIIFCFFVAMNTTYYSVAYAHSAVILHPISTGTIGMVLIIIGSIPMAPVVYASKYLLEAFGSLYVNILNVTLIGIAGVISLFVRNERQSNPPAFSAIDKEIDAREDSKILNVDHDENKINSFV